MNNNKKTPHWINHLMEVISDSWQYKGVCNHFNFKSSYNQKAKMWQISVAPVFQEIFGGHKDGQQTWTPFIFDAGEFAQRSGIKIDNYAVASLGFGNQGLSLPHMLIQGRVLGKTRDRQFFLKIMLEPAKETKTIEILDTYKKEIREAKGNNV